MTMNSDPNGAAPVPVDGPPRRRKWVIGLKIGALIAVLGLMAAIVLPNFVKARSTPCKVACVANLRQIDGATEQWALEHKKKDGEAVTFDDLAPYLKDGTAPTCPGKGKGIWIYSVTVVGARPTCSFEYEDKTAGHSIGPVN